MSASTNHPIPDDEHSPFVVKVYRSDQSFKFFPIHKVRGSSNSLPVEHSAHSLSGYHSKRTSHAGYHGVRYRRFEQVNVVRNSIDNLFDLSENERYPNLLLIFAALRLLA